MASALQYNRYNVPDDHQFDCKSATAKVVPKKTSMSLLLIDDLTNPLTRLILQGLMSLAQRRAHRTMVCGMN